MIFTSTCDLASQTASQRMPQFNTIYSNLERPFTVFPAALSQSNQPWTQINWPGLESARAIAVIMLQRMGYGIPLKKAGLTEWRTWILSELGDMSKLICIWNTEAGICFSTSYTFIIDFSESMSYISINFPCPFTMLGPFLLAVLAPSALDSLPAKPCHRAAWWQRGLKSHPAMWRISTVSGRTQQVSGQ